MFGGHLNALGKRARLPEGDCYWLPPTRARPEAAAEAQAGFLRVRYNFSTPPCENRKSPYLVGVVEKARLAGRA